MEQDDQNDVAAQLFGDLVANNGDADNDNNFEIEMDEEDEQPEGGGEEVIDGGVAEGGGSDKQNSGDCDLVLNITCPKALEIAPNHPILRPGLKVSIGLEKNTKLSAVFKRYVEICNEFHPSHRIGHEDLEFCHSQLLHANDTAEASALMKNDKLIVRQNQSAEREAGNERRRLQRDADRNFFQQMRLLMPEFGGSKTADVLLDCRGKLVDDSGRNQQVLRTTVRAHSGLIQKRCPWLGGIIDQARIEAASQSISRSEGPQIPEVEQDDCDGSKAEIVRRVELEGGKSADEDDDDDIAVLPFSHELKEETNGTENSNVAEIENDEEDQPFDEGVKRGESPVVVPISHSNDEKSGEPKDLLNVVLPDHSPEAVKILLEYCYTNRVLGLGHEAFMQGCRTRPTKHHGPVAPYQSSSSSSRRWPSSGSPLVSFPVALAGISLAEQAGMHRLSLMCEVAAAELVTSARVVEALSMCTTHKDVSGNDLPRLRKAAMDMVLGSGSRGVTELGRTPTFRKALDERRTMIVPTLLKGTMEAVTAHEKGRGTKRDRTEMAFATFEELDREDTYKRERERRKRRQERWSRDPSRRTEQAFEDDLDGYFDPILSGWASEAAKRSLKRMSYHLESLSGRQQGSSRSRVAPLSVPSSSGSSRSRIPVPSPSSTRRRSSSGRRRHTKN